jgi:cobalamin biosynthesis protein CobT
MLLTGTGGYGDLSAMVTQELTDLAAQTRQHLRHDIPLLPKVGRRRASPNKLDETHALAACSRMRSRLLTLLQAETLQPRHYGSSGRKLVGKRLVRMALGDARLFARRVESRALSTAVIILLDTSGSMFDECAGGLKRFEIANPAAYALHVALKGLPGVVAASAAFATPSRHQPSVNILVDFAEAPKSNAFNLQPDGGTPTHDALWYARAALLQRPESRKIILLLTDGFPMNGEETLAATKRCEKDGIEIAALGINTEAVRRYWKNFEVIKDVRDLPQAMFIMIEQSLLSQKIF